MFSLTILFLALTVATVQSFDWHDEGTLYWADNCDWPGNDMSNVQVPGEQCGGVCLSTSGCTHFTWTSWNGGTCFLKQGPCSLDQAVYYGDTSSCGMIKNIQPGCMYET